MPSSTLDITFRRFVSNSLKVSFSGESGILWWIRLSLPSYSSGFSTSNHNTFIVSAMVPTREPWECRNPHRPNNVCPGVVSFKKTNTGISSRWSITAQVKDYSGIELQSFFFDSGGEY